jgi:hypothetical protein
MLKFNGVEEHVSYPKGTYRKHRAKAINTIYGAMGLSPHPIDNSTFDTVAGDCAHQQNSLQELEARPQNAIPKFKYFNATFVHLLHLFDYKRGFDAKFTDDEVEKSFQWQTTHVFRYCRRMLSERFLSYFDKKMDIEAIDGIKYPKLPDYTTE